MENKTKVFVTKYVFASGIREYVGEIVSGSLFRGKDVDWDNKYWSVLLSTKDFFLNREDAIADAERRRLKKIESVKRQLKKLEALKFS